MKVRFFSLLLLVAGISGCQSNQTIETGAVEQIKEVEVSKSGTLESAQWQLHQLNSKPAPKGQGGKPIFMRFDTTKNQVSGFAGCNNFFGQYTVNEQALKFSHLAMTKKFCKNTMGIESQFAKSMAMVKSFKLIDSKLHLIDEQDIVIAEFIQD